MQQENSETSVPDVTMSSSSATEVIAQPSSDAEMREQSTAADSITTPNASESAGTVADQPVDKKQQDDTKVGEEDNQKEIVDGNNETSSVKVYKGLQN